jgi:hypothetical protein
LSGWRGYLNQGDGRGNLMKQEPDFEGSRRFKDAQDDAVRENLKKLQLPRDIALTPASFQNLPRIFKQRAIKTLGIWIKELGADFGTAVSLAVHIYWRGLFIEVFDRQNKEKRPVDGKYKVKCSDAFLKKVSEHEGRDYFFYVGIVEQEIVTLSDLIESEPNKKQFSVDALSDCIYLYFLNQASLLFEIGESEVGFVYVYEATQIEITRAYQNGWDEGFESDQSWEHENEDGESSIGLSENGRRAAQARHRRTNEEKVEVLRMWNELKLKKISKNSAAKKIASAPGITVKLETVRSWLQGAHL